MAEKKQFLEIGKIINTHGVRGEVKIDPWCDSPEVFCALSRVYLEDKTEFTVEKSVFAYKFIKYFMSFRINFRNVLDRKG